MSAVVKDAVVCPVCHSELSIEQLTAHMEDRDAFAQLLALSVPLPRLVAAYLAMHKPQKQALTLRKKVRIVAQLLPDLRRGAITHKGRDWAAPPESWQRAIEQMVAARAAGRLDLPLSGHGYLYAILAGMADKAEASAEAQREAERKTGAAAAHTVTVRGQPMPITDALQEVYGAPRQAATNPAPVPAHVREQLQRLRGGARPENKGGVA